MEKTDAANFDRIYNSELFRGFDLGAAQRALLGAVCRLYKHREFVFHAGDLARTFYVVVDGALKLIRHSPKGEDIIVHFALEGDIVGALLMNQGDQAVFPISAKSMGLSKVICIPKSTFREHWLSNADLQRRLNAHLYRRMSNIQDDKTMSTSPLRVRIANLLLRHLDCESDSQNQSLSLALTRQEIADSLGVAVESVIRIMREFQDDGTIVKPPGKGPESINVQMLLMHVEPRSGS